MHAFHCFLPFLALIAGCAWGPPGDLVGSDGRSCVGKLEPIAGLRAARDPALVTQAKGPPGKGGLCDGRAFVVDAPVTVYRVWDGARQSSEFGSWWSLERPVQTRDDYRRRYAICPEWSALDRVIACSLQPGSSLVLGPGQSVDCAAGTPALPATPDVQVYLPVDGAFLQACSSSPWP